MKKTYSIILGAILVVALASCKKDYTCNCSLTWTNSFLGDTTWTTSGTIENSSKEDAEGACTQSNGSIDDGFGGTIVTDCQLD